MKKTRNRLSIWMTLCGMAIPLAAASWTLARAQHADALDRTKILAAWRESAQAYARQDYEGALQQWQTLADRGFQHPDLFYNMGNAYYQTGRHGHAAWMFEKSLRLNPRDEEARHNLKIARGASADSEESAASFILLPFVWLANLLTPDEWARLASILWWLAAMALGIWILSNNRRIARHAQQVAAVAAVLLIVSLCFLAPRLYQAEHERYGIVLDDRTTVRSGPGENESAYFEARAGERMEISESPVRGWIRVKRPADGRVGFLPETAIGRV